MKANLEAISEWELLESSTDSNVIQQNETLFALSNGHIGTRGSLEEVSITPEYSHSEGTYLNGFYDTSPIQYGEWAYGYAKEDQTIIPLPNGKKFKMTLDADTFNLNSGKTPQHERILNLKEGVLKRLFKWENSAGNSIEVNMERFVSYDYPEIIAQRVEITPLQSGSRLTLEAELDDLQNIQRIISEDESFDPRKKDQTKRRFESKVVTNENIILLNILTHNSGLRTNVGTISSLKLKDYNKKTTHLTEQWTVQTEKDHKIILERFVGYGKIYKEDSDTENQLNQLADTLKEVQSLGYEALKQRHIELMARFWEKSDIKIAGDDDLQIGLRFNIFHLNQAAGRDGKTNIAAKGITGEGYEGHYFWDTEMYMLPFFIYTQPKTAKKLLAYRHSILPNARKRAREMSVGNGALYAWRTINGEEASPYYPAGTAQVHINADIAHGVYTYIKATGDKAFAFNEGLEILIETARFWVNYGHYNPRKNHAFVINGVTGPDEYTAIVDNNYYTNIMAKHNLKYAIEITEKAIGESLTESKDMLKRIEFNEEELMEWQKAAAAMYLPYDEESKLTMQDDSFFDLKVWDLENTPKEKHPLLLHYHPLTIYRHQVNKQADTVLAQFMFSWEFDLEQKIRDYEYYENISTHDSSLSRSIYSMMASEIGDLEKAYNYFMDTALMDLTDMQSNTKDGVHAANMGGTWMSLVYGFAGLRLYDGQLHFSPKLPKKWSRLAFNIQYQNSIVHIDIQEHGTHYTLLEGEPLAIYHNDEKKTLDKGLGE